MAEFLHILAEQYDYPQLSDEILKYDTRATRKAQFSFR
jgi:hypothetical protein